MEQLPRKPSAVALVVESDVHRRNEMAARLRRGGFEVFEAANATEAITVLKNTVVDVLISRKRSVAGVPGPWCTADLDGRGWHRRHPPKAKRFLRILEKALAIHVADRDRLTKRLARRGR
jgi:hypothetical protein